MEGNFRRDVFKAVTNGVVYSMFLLENTLEYGEAPPDCVAAAPTVDLWTHKTKNHNNKKETHAVTRTA